MHSADLALLDAFAAVARHRSFRRAARERGVSASTLSESMKRLEHQLGVRLLNRTTRSVTLTEPGRRLYERLNPMLDELGEALDEVNSFRDSPGGLLRLNVPGPVARLVLAPMLAEFLAAYPDLTLEVHLEERLVDVIEAGFDAGARYGESLAQDMIAVPLGPPQRYGVYASPSYLERHGVPSTPHDLLAHRCILLRFAGGAVRPWEFEKDGRTLMIEPRGPFISNNSDMMIRATIDGVGIGMNFSEFAAPAVARGELVSLLEDWCPPFEGPFLYYPSRRHMPVALRVFLDFVRARNARSGNAVSV
ncbi:LysR family transcriptional regulator [Ancylobacter mangrovi]|uniref:LysR family transcriptional regulator n=1 Tax=Ancylobacter mangrovi TaxID=2972472 RepID=UPI0021638404|nr:LysR family transcriptional regulator [Ancylobacter mangrovi]MCS0503902.1 LysR family transcriptional regulator [Ancylobacter mangrovi]